MTYMQHFKKKGTDDVCYPRMNLENMTLSGRNQLQKDKHHLIPLTQGALRIRFTDRGRRTTVVLRN